MFERNIYDLYGLYCESRFQVDQHLGFFAEGHRYLMIPKEEGVGVTDEEMVGMAEHLRTFGDLSVPELIRTNRGHYHSQIDGQEVYLFKLSADRAVRAVPRDEREVGEHLAHFHQMGSQIILSAGQQSYFGQWHKLWEKRLEQLEGWYQQVFQDQPSSYLDESFLYTFPYFMGLTENAIQYAVDAVYDEQLQGHDFGSICHRRFRNDTWLRDEGYSMIKPPTEFIYDHPSRDLAEWIRSIRWQTRSEEDWRTIRSFLQAYHTHHPLSAYGWKLVFARLLFPLHYFEAVEGYYRSQINEEREQYAEQFYHVIHEEYKNEQFLTELAHELEQSSAVMLRLPKIDWLVIQDSPHPFFPSG
ncbi:spore coat putative kinase YutH [Halalkalibacterium ligniniphilum]|uniref:spore coat putative kinase YutH n=1 Tax=Halalkalibacterium ligniniphilum TaxID=1134413 RepID=UPI0003479EBE|nr:spore coat protein YutH [Halalkalibacterium ligniniphilum]